MEHLMARLSDYNLKGTIMPKVICNKAKDCSFQFCPHKVEHEEKKEIIFCREIFCTIEARCAITQEYAKCIPINKKSTLN